MLANGIWALKTLCFLLLLESFASITMGLLLELRMDEVVVNIVFGELLLLEEELMEMELVSEVESCCWFVEPKGRRRLAVLGMSKTPLLLRFCEEFSG